MKRRSSKRVPGTALTLFVDCVVTVVAGVSWETAATLPLLFEWKSANVPLLSQLVSPSGMVSNLKVPKTRSRQVESVTTSFDNTCLLYTSPSPRDQRGSRMPSSA